MCGPDLDTDWDKPIAKYIFEMTQGIRTWIGHYVIFKQFS